MTGPRAISALALVLTTAALGQQPGPRGWVAAGRFVTRVGISRRATPPRR